ncbi:somatostatin receptor type 1-like [Lytechinus pictus]|uniref:somatostatin receptor type 1-like n=1 Tax=Lytechinus pictus TaxID=7653 RepID=UPI00240CF1F4|nr:somatostatin receptor type 1-like [Lytechinus pictus]
MSTDVDSLYTMVSESSYTNSMNSTDDGNWLFLFTGSLYYIVAIVGLIGNGTVIYVILRFAKMKTVTNVYILNLALADNLFLIALIFLATATVHPIWIFGKVLCHLVYSIDALNLFTSIFCLTLMAIDRYVAVCYAVKASCYRNMRVATIINVGVWLLALAAASPIIVFTRYDPEQLSCNLQFDKVVGAHAALAVAKGFCFYTFITGFLIPLVVIAACYSMIIVRLHQMGTKTGKWEKSRKVNRLVLCVIIVFVVFWSPFFLFRFIVAFDFEVMRTNYLVNEITILLSYMNSCANPFLYGFLSDSFKKSFKKVWRCGDRRGYELTSTDARPWRLRNPCLGEKKERSSARRLGKRNDDDTMSGARLNVYPLTAVTSAASEITMHQKNGAMGAPSYA